MSAPGVALVAGRLAGRLAGRARWQGGMPRPARRGAPGADPYSKAADSDPTYTLVCEEPRNEPKPTVHRETDQGH